jgi:hypothetical protein
MDIMQDIIAAAQEAARKAAQDLVDANPGVWYPCGFSWVKIRPARGPLVKALREMGLGETDDFEGGFRVYNPSGHHTQWMDAKHEGSRAFVEVLKKYFPDIKMSAQSRID